MARHALRLGKLDFVFRSRRVEPDVFDDPAPEDVDDLVALLSVVPFDRLLQGEPVLLNPTFGDASYTVGGADADLICGDLLVDVKTTKKPEMDVGDLDALLGYLLLARRRRLADPSFPEVRRAALYFSRHGHLWELPASVWTGQPQFAEVEAWFFDHARDLGPVTA